MKILWFTWKDLTHPQAGGAETVNEEYAARLAADGNEVILIVGGYKNCTPKAIINGYQVIRLGNRYTVYWHAWRYYRKNLKGWADLVIDEVNTVPFFTKFYVKEPNILLVYMLCREIWFYQLIFPLSLIGYLIEPIYLWLLRDRKILTESESTKNDLLRFGFNSDNITIFSVGIDIEPISSLSKVKKYDQFTLLSFGALRPMKKTIDQIIAFEKVKELIPECKLKIAGDASGKYGQKIIKKIAYSNYKKDIEFLGRVNEPTKINLMQKCHLIMVTSIKEGWGLIVTEAASQSTPAIVYNVDGLRDSVKNNITGIICSQNNPLNIAENILKLYNNRKQYTKIKSYAWRSSFECNYDNGYEVFLRAIKT
ncbi:MAG: glycosyltransferase family 4 protein [Candidatus Saccharimonadales bacterium]